MLEIFKKLCKKDNLTTKNGEEDFKGAQITCTHIYIHMHARTHAHTHTHIHIHTYTHMHIHTHPQTHLKFLDLSATWYQSTEKLWSLANDKAF